MSRPSIQHIKLSPELTLSECHPDSQCRKINWWLYDTRAGMNLAMRAATNEEALVEVINYWAERCMSLEKTHHELCVKVTAFIEAVSPERSCEDE